MTLYKFLVASGLLAKALAIPLSGNATRSVLIRDNVNMPVIGEGWDEVETQQIMDAFRDALEIASYVRVSEASTVDPIFAKWFNTGDRDLVNAVFDTILGGDPMDPPGNPLLSAITIVPDFPNDKGKLTCDGGTLGAMRGYTTDNPKIILCNPGALGHGGISKGYNDDGSDCDPQGDCDVHAIVCEKLDPNVSWRMETLGATLLHEYTHFTKMVAAGNGPLSKETDDHAVGVWKAFNIDKTMATDNADSYVSFGNQVLWSVICRKSFGDPTEDDSDDPNCDDDACEDGTIPDDDE